jgi:hypothetical protein
MSFPDPYVVERDTRLLRGTKGAQKDVARVRAGRGLALTIVGAARLSILRCSHALH